ncbi:MAG: phosphopantothenoylcysteine decarboxylase, partial [Chthoniobacterales bacterium]
MNRPAAIVTTGPASAAIDEVRCITNFATGEIGVVLAGP